MPKPTAIVLIAHGSPDPDWHQPLVAMAARLRERLAREHVAREGKPRQVVLAYLGSSSPSVDEAIGELYEGGHREVLVLSAFLSPGGKHIKRDVPQVIDTLRSRHPELHLVLQHGALGAEPEVVEAMASAAARLVQGVSVVGGEVRGS